MNTDNTDILLTPEGDVRLTPDGDISLTGSVIQAVKIRLRWILGEWRLGPDAGFPWFERVLVKNPDVTGIRRLLRNEIMTVDGIDDAAVTDVRFDPAARTAAFSFVCRIGDEIYRDEVVIYGN